MKLSHKNRARHVRRVEARAAAAGRKPAPRSTFKIVKNGDGFALEAARPNGVKSIIAEGFDSQKLAGEHAAEQYGEKAKKYTAPRAKKVAATEQPAEEAA